VRPRDTGYREAVVARVREVNVFERKKVRIGRRKQRMSEMRMDVVETTSNSPKRHLFLHAAL
jgi:hypothetical protein